jgi:small-conductance mechanosensitive channel
MNVTEIKAYQEKVGAQLQEAKAMLSGFEAHAKGKLAQSEIDTISRLKAKNQEIDKKVHQDLKVTGEVTLAAKIKADIDAEMAKFKASLDQLNTKVKSQPTAR